MVTTIFRRRPERSARRWALLPAVALVLALMLSASAAATDGSDLLSADEVRVSGTDVPLHERFVYHGNNDATNRRIGGFVHGVRRIEGGTALYYSIGAAAGDTDTFLGISAFDNSSSPYPPGYAVDMRLLDTVNLVAYRPMAVGGQTFGVKMGELDSVPGQLRVGMAVFPPLPEDVTTVSVIMAYGMAAGDVPVEEGALEPVADEIAPLLGEGWPALPDPVVVAQTDPEAFTTSLTRRTSDIEGAAATEETPQEVSMTLDANVLFEFDSADLSAQARDALTAVAEDIRARGRGEVVVTGHTDSQGSSGYNQTLSEERAAAVVAALQGAAGDAVTFSAHGRGSNDPVASNETDEGRQQNRRVTVVYQVGEGS